METVKENVKHVVLQDIDTNQQQQATSTEAADEKKTRKNVTPDRDDEQNQNGKKPRLEANDENSSSSEDDEPELSLEQLREKSRLEWAKDPKSMDFDEAYDDVMGKYEEESRGGLLPLPEDTVCSFVVHNLKCKEDCYSKKDDYRESDSDYTVDLLLQHHGLYDLLVKVMEIPIKEKLTGGYSADNRCVITFDGKSYLNDHSWYYDQNEIPQRQIEGFCDAQDIQVLKDLDLKSGLKGKLEFDASLSFEFYVQDISVPPEKGTRYPTISPLSNRFSADLSEDWITATEKDKSSRVRMAWKHYYEGHNATTRCRRTHQIVSCKPNVPIWGWDEIELLGLLINAGHKFKKSWNNILQHALVSRQESATSVKWYQLAKGGMVQTSGNYATLKNFGKGKSDNAKVRLAKKLAKARVEAMPKPPTYAGIL